MSDGFVALYIFMLAAIAGHVIISRVPVILHTPLMSGSNFIHGIVLIGAMVVLGHAQTPLEKARLPRRGARCRQRRRWLRGHRAHAGNVRRARPRGQTNRRSRRLEHQHRRTARLAGQGQLPRCRHAVPSGPSAHGLAADRAQRHPLGRAGHAAGHGGDLLAPRTAQRAADPGGAVARRRPCLVVGRQGRHHRHAADGGAVQRHGRWLGGGDRCGGTAALRLPGPSRYPPLERAGAGRPGRAPAVGHGAAAGGGRRGDRCRVAVRFGDCRAKLDGRPTSA